MSGFNIFEQARLRALQRWNDPNWSMLLWGRRELEHQQGVCGFDPWRNGLEANRKNIKRFAMYSGLERKEGGDDDAREASGHRRRCSCA